MTLSLIGDCSTSAMRPHVIQSSVDNAANETLLLTTRCSKRKIADSTQDSLPISKRHPSQSIRTLPSAIMSNSVHQMKLQKTKLQ
jgi:hypothetical protein